MSLTTPRTGVWTHLFQYALALAVTGAATLLRQLLDPALGDGVPFVTFFLGNALVIAFTGIGPSILAILLATLAADWFFLSPRHSLGLTATQAVTCMVFLLGNLVILGLAAAMRRARLRAEASAQLALQQQEKLQNALAEQERTQDTVRQQNTLLEGINRIFSEALSCRTEEELGRMCLTQAEKVTGSKFGFMGELNPKTGLLDDIAISNPGWAACEMQEKLGHGTTIPVNLKVHGIYGRVLLDRKGFFDNSPATHPDRIGTPEGHPVLTSFLGVPLIHEGKTIGMIAVANREGGYRQTDLEALESIAAASVQALMGRRAEQAALENARRINRAQEIAHLGSWELDVARNHVTWSDEVYRILGLKPQEFAASYAAFLDAIHPEDRTLVDEAYSGSVRNGSDGYEIEHRVIRKATGEVRVVHGRCEHSRDDSGRVVRSLGMVQDITERKKAEQALQHSEERYRFLFENMLDGFAFCKMVFDEAGRPSDCIYLAVNTAFERLTGLRGVEGKAATTVIPEIRKAHPELFGLFERVAHSGKPERFEIHFTPLSKWLTVSVYSPEQDYFVAIFDDITARKNAEAALKKSHEELEQRVAERTAELNRTMEAVKSERQRFHNVLNELPVYVALLTTDYHVPFANRVFLERFGEAHGKRCYEHLFGRTEPCELCETYKVLKTSEPQKWEWLGPDGRNYKVFDFPFKDTDGSTIILEMGIDVTDHKQAEAELAKYRQHLEDQVKHRTLQLQASNAQLRGEIVERQRVEVALREREQHLNAVFMASMDALVVIDDGGAFLDANPAAARLLATPIEVLKGSRIDLYLPSGFNFTATWNEFKQRGRFEGVHDLIRPDGVRLTVEQYAVAEILPGRHLAVIHDITDRKRMIHALTKAKEDLRRHAENMEKLVEERTAKLQDLVAEWEHFSYTISHDMRAPLRAMQGFAELMWESGCEGCADKTAKDFLHRIRKGANRLDLMITDALQYTRAVQCNMELVPVQTGSLMRGIIQSYPNLQPVHADITLEHELPWVLGSESALTQCFSNLLGNAVKFVAQGVRPTVRVWAEERGNLIRLCFKDNGIGIPQEHQGGLFRMFQRVCKTHEGTGIGLALVRKNVERMGGRVGLDSEAGKGSIFWVELQKASCFRQPQSVKELDP